MIVILNVSLESQPDNNLKKRNFELTDGTKESRVESSKGRTSKAFACSSKALRDVCSLFFSVAPIFLFPSLHAPLSRVAPSV